MNCWLLFGLNFKLKHSGSWISRWFCRSNQLTFPWNNWWVQIAIFDIIEFNLVKCMNHMNDELSVFCIQINCRLIILIILTEWIDGDIMQRQMPNTTIYLSSIECNVFFFNIDEVGQKWNTENNDDNDNNNNQRLDLIKTKLKWTMCQHT